MNKRLTIFLISLVVFLFAYIYSTSKMIVFNHSGETISKLVVDAAFTHNELVNIENGEVLTFTIFSPFDKKVHLNIQQPNQIRSKTFKLQGLFVTQKYNQVEIGAVDIRTGNLGLQKSK